jgi:hypothetical protein
VHSEFIIPRCARPSPVSPRRDSLSHGERQDTILGAVMPGCAGWMYSFSYDGRHPRESVTLRMISGKIPRARFRARAAMEVSQKARPRLRWFEYYETPGRNAARPCRYWDIRRPTFYGGGRRYDRDNRGSREDGSHRPQWRRQYPRWGKDQRVVLLRRQGRRVSTSRGGGEFSGL